jgi:hypothetical protein
VIERLLHGQPVERRHHLVSRMSGDDDHGACAGCERGLCGAPHQRLAVELFRQFRHALHAA